jgi:hypothetical protein
VPQRRRVQPIRAGYLADPDQEYGHIYNPQATTLPNIFEIPCLILLGEPGIGKSDEIGTQFEELKQDCVNDSFLYFELRDFQTDLKLALDIFDNNPIFQDWLKGHNKLHIFLDSLDEGLLSISNLSSILLKELKKYPTDRLCLRITCRTAEWPLFLEEGFQKLWSEVNVKAFEILLLREKDVIEAAIQEGINSDKFIDEISNKEVVPLAIKPVTLNFLLNTFKKSGQFPHSQTDLYVQGCTKLCEETNKGRPLHPYKSRLSAPKKLHIASRIAAISMFGNRSAIWTDIDLGNIPEGDVSLSELSGGTESLGNSKFSVEEDEILETLNTGLFSSRGSNRMGWAHQTYAEFLAAYYLKLHDIPTRQKLNLLINANSDNKIAPQLYETAGWLASLDNQIFRQIAENDPTVLLKSDVATVDEKDKISLIEALLDIANKEEWLIDNVDAYRRFHKLKYPNLANQLRPFIMGADKSPLARRIATDIAEACKIQELQDSLVELVTNKDESLPLRENAAHAIVWIADRDTKVKLKNFIFEDNADDLNDNLKGYALDALYPDQLSADELFNSLTYPKQPNYLGSYQSFLFNDFTQYLNVAGIIEGLKWIQENDITFNRTSPFSKIRKSIMKAAWINFEDYDVLKNLAQTIATSLRHDHEDLEDLVITEKSRHKVLEALMPLFPKIKDHIFWLVYHRPFLVQQSDFHWLLEHFFIEESLLIQEGLLELIQRVFNIQNVDHIESMILASKKSPAIAKAFAWGLEPIMLDSPRAKALREEHEKMQKLTNRGSNDAEINLLEPPPVERIKQHLEKCESGELDSWWRLNMEMTLEPDSTDYGSDYESDLAKLPGWKSSTTEIKQRILNAAREYVLYGNPEEEKWLGKNLTYRPAFAGYRALRLLSTEDAPFIEQLTINCWQKWAGIILTFPFQSNENDIEFYRGMVDLAYKKAPFQIANAVLLQIDQENECSGSLHFLSVLENCWNGELVKTMTEKVKDKKLKPFCMGQILGHLLNQWC